MKILLYGNGGSGNHGCEAIVRGTVELLKEQNHSFVISSSAIEEDFKYGLDGIAEILPAKSDINHFSLSFLRAYFRMKMLHSYTEMDGLYYLPQIKKVPDIVDVAFSVGGDNYCYSDTEIYAYLNRAYHNAGIKTILWGCSVEPDVVQKSSVSKDLAKYNFIVARESITYEAVQKVNANVLLAPDPAFFMSAIPCDLDERFDKHDVIGINISPMIVANETRKGTAVENYRNLIRFILKNTDFYIALIPHVVWESNDDGQVLNMLYQEFDQDERLILVKDHTAPELKYIISKCKMFVGARTHATIAAYSSCVPTLVVGYSVKARGIAKDLFGREDTYILPVQSLKTGDELVKRFIELLDNEQNVHLHLSSFIPEYKMRSETVLTALEKV